MQSITTNTVPSILTIAKIESAARWQRTLTYRAAIAKNDDQRNKVLSLWAEKEAEASKAIES